MGNIECSSQDPRKADVEIFSVSAGSQGQYCIAPLGDLLQRQNVEAYIPEERILIRDIILYPWFTLGSSSILAYPLLFAVSYLFL